MDVQTQIEILNALKSGALASGGKLPARFAENEHIVDPDTEQAQYFQRYMEKLTKKLLPDFDFSKKEVRFLLSDSDDVNAYVFPGYNPAVMVFSKGLLNFCKNEDELAYILGHELSHVLIKDELGNAGHISKPEEALCDIKPIAWMIEAGYNPFAARSVVNRLLKIQSGGKILSESEMQEMIDNDAATQAVIALIDEHASPALRASYINNVIAGYAKITGAEDGYEHIRNTKKDKTLAAKVKSAHHVSYCDRLWDESNFDKLAPKAQLQIILDHIPHTKEGSEDRAKELNDMLKDVRCDHTDPEHRQFGEKMLALLPDHPLALNHMYGNIVGKLLGTDAVKPMGDLIPLEQAAGDMVNAQSRENFQQAAEKITSLIDARPQIQYNMLRWPSFALPTKSDFMKAATAETLDGFTLPWNNHVRWALDMAKEGNYAGCRALLYLGVEDQRLYPPLPMEIFGPLSQNVNYNPDRNYPITRPTGVRLKHCMIDFNKGKLSNLVVGNPISIGVEPWNPERYISGLLSKKVNAKEIDRFSQNPVSDMVANTGTLQEDFSNWLEQNRLGLRPPAAFSDSIGPLLQDLVEKDLNPFHLLAPEEKQIHEHLYLPYKKNTSMLVSQLDYLASQGDEGKAVIKEFFAQDPDSIKSIFDEDDAPESPERNLDWIMKSGKTRIRIPATAPIIKFVATDKYDLFSIREKAHILEQFAQIPLQDEWWQKTWRYAKPQQPDDYLKIFDLYEDITKSRFNRSHFTFRAKFTGYAGQYLLSKRPGKLDVTDFIAQYGKMIGDIYRQECQDRDGKITSIGTLLVRHIVAIEHWPDDAEKLSRIYKNLEQYGLFPDRTMQEEVATRLITLLKAEADPVKRIEKLEGLLFKTMVRNVALREQAMNLWVESVLENQSRLGLGIDGTDDGSEIYKASITPLVERVTEHTPPSFGREMLSRLADALETQRDLSYQFRDTFQLTGKALKDSDGYVRLLEATLVIFSEKSEERIACIEFLTNPLTNDSIESFALRLKRHADRVAKKGANQLSWHELQIYEAMAADRPPSFFQLMAKDLYDNYWNLPLAARAPIMDELLVPSRHRSYADTSLLDEEAAEPKPSKAKRGQEPKQDTKRQKNSDAAYAEAFTYVTHRLMPVDMKYGRQARKFIEMYRSIMPESQRNLLLAVMLSVEKTSHESGGEQFGIGKRLAMILDMMGPAERKLGQAIHSHPQTPEDIRGDMERLKSQASPGTRWEAWEDLDRTVHPDYQSQIKRLGKFKGSASYFKSFDIERMDGTSGVIQFQRNNAPPQAREGFRLLEKFVGRLRTHDPESAEVCDVMSDMLEQARNMTGIETNADIGAKQVEHAQHLYNGLTITVGQQTFTCSTASWRAYGPEFRDQEKMPGVHFNDLPENTPQELAYKKSVAKAYMMLEFRNLLSGEAFDHDRHGAQLRVDPATNQLGLFDHGAIHAEVYKHDGLLAKPYEPQYAESDDYVKALSEGGRIEIPKPTPAEKKLLANTLFTALSKFMQDKTPLADTLYSEVKRLRKAGAAPEHLVRVQRALLALNDFIGIGSSITNGQDQRILQSKYVSQQDMVDILVGLSKNGHIDQEIQSSLASKLAGNKLKNLFKRGVSFAGFEAKENVDLDDTARAGTAISPVRYDAPPKENDLNTSPATNGSDQPSTDEGSIRRKDNPVKAQLKATESGTWSNRRQPLGDRTTHHTFTELSARQPRTLY